MSEYLTPWMLAEALPRELRDGDAVEFRRGLYSVS